MKSALITLYRLFLFALVVASVGGCVVWPHTTSSYQVRGHVFDNRTLRPIKDVAIEVNFPETREEQKTQTGRDGSFSVQSDGQWNWILYFWGDELPDVPLEMSLRHPRYDSEDVEDLSVREREKGRFLNVGSLYLDRKR